MKTIQVLIAASLALFTSNASAQVTYELNLGDSLEGKIELKEQPDILFVDPQDIGKGKTIASQAEAERTARRQAERAAEIAREEAENARRQAAQAVTPPSVEINETDSDGGGVQPGSSETQQVENNSSSDVPTPTEDASDLPVPAPVATAATGSASDKSLQSLLEQSVVEDEVAQPAVLPQPSATDDVATAAFTPVAEPTPVVIIPDQATVPLVTPPPTVQSDDVATAASTPVAEPTPVVIIPDQATVPLVTPPPAVQSASPSPTDSVTSPAMIDLGNLDAIEGQLNDGVSNNGPSLSAISTRPIIN